MKGILLYVSEAVAQTPANGECIAGYWWTVHPAHGLAFYMDQRRSRMLEPEDTEEPAPQCNRDRLTAETLQQRLWPDHEVRQYPAVFLTHATKEMHRLRKLAAAQSVA